MEKELLPPPDKNGIIKALAGELSEENRQRLKKFGTFMFLYDFVQDHFVRPRLHKADSLRHREILKNQISQVKDSYVLDIACGTGGAIPLFDSSNDYTGLDLSYAMLEQGVKKAKKQLFRRYRFVQGNAEHLLFEDESFDFVLMDTALHMIPKYQRAIEEAGRVLTKDGVFFCSTPVVGINSEFDATWKRIAGKRALHSFSEDDIKAVCSSSGLIYNLIDTNGGVLYFHTQKAK